MIKNLSYLTVKHEQFKIAEEYMTTVLDYQIICQKVNQAIQENKLLDAHLLIHKMEKCRHDLLEDLSKPSERSSFTSDILVNICISELFSISYF